MDQLVNIESQIKLLWEKAQQAGAVIAKLREEKKALQALNDKLEHELTQLRLEVAAREQQVHKLTVEQSAHDAKPTATISNGERDQLTAKVKELLARIDAYL